ncbi:hypothetical protein QQX13_00205 [Demequina sp. SYSU T00068]|uniref:hypothetical protein n=1 Tax=Demequina lignilytica TaxID=3051663 RepID=UPI0026345893|nr:hypothetical protein [Demequina sp. SYSU T00068]MDN4489245.1 hypothetical protein [Demequina sp. SYSU T00068]
MARVLDPGETVVASASTDRPGHYLVRTDARILHCGPKNPRLPLAPGESLRLIADEHGNARVRVRLAGSFNSARADSCRVLLTVPGQAGNDFIDIGTLYGPLYRGADLKRQPFARALRRLRFDDAVINAVCSSIANQITWTRNPWLDTTDEPVWTKESVEGSGKERSDITRAIARLEHGTGAVAPRLGRLANRLEAGEYVYALCGATVVMSRYEKQWGLAAVTNRRVIVMGVTVVSADDNAVDLRGLTAASLSRDGDGERLAVTGHAIDPANGMPLLHPKTGEPWAFERQYLCHLDPLDAPQFFVRLERLIAAAALPGDEEPLMQAQQFRPGKLDGPSLFARLYPDRLEVDSFEVSPGRATALGAGLLLGPGALVPAVIGGIHSPRRTATLRLSEVTDVRTTPQKSGFRVTVLGDGRRIAFDAPRDFSDRLQAQVEQARSNAKMPSAQVLPSAGGGNDLADSLARLAALHSAGALTSEEFAAAKARVLGD